MRDILERKNIKTILKKVTQWLKPNHQYVIKEKKDSFTIKVDKGGGMAKDIFTKKQLEFLIELHNTKPRWFDEWHKEEFQPLKKNVDLIMRCPTIKKEIAELDPQE